MNSKSNILLFLFMLMQCEPSNVNDQNRTLTLLLVSEMAWIKQQRRRQKWQQSKLRSTMTWWIVYYCYCCCNQHSNYLLHTFFLFIYVKFYSYIIWVLWYFGEKLISKWFEKCTQSIDSIPKWLIKTNMLF